jgi:hypothetical protein
MANERTLTLEFKVDSDGDLTSGEFLSLFRYVDEIGRAVAENETFAFIEFLDLPPGYRNQLFSSILATGRQIATPVEIKSIERGSWHVFAVLSGPAILWLAQKFLAVPVAQAWDSSAAREHMVSFLRDRVFGGAKQIVEDHAAQRPTFGNLKIVEIKEIRSTVDQPKVLIRLRRSEVIEVKYSDKQLIENFVKQLQGR